LKEIEDGPDEPTIKNKEGGDLIVAEDNDSGEITW
jgi:hypothetical protein